MGWLTDEGIGVITAIVISLVILMPFLNNAGFFGSMVGGFNTALYSGGDFICRSNFGGGCGIFYVFFILAFIGFIIGLIFWVINELIRRRREDKQVKVKIIR